MALDSQCGGALSACTALGGFEGKKVGFAVHNAAHIQLLL
jgi:hypothetical protein